MSLPKVQTDSRDQDALALGLHALGFRFAQGLCRRAAYSSRAEADRCAHGIVDELAEALGLANRGLPRVAAAVWRAWITTGGELTPAEMASASGLSRREVARQWDLACAGILRALDDMPLSGVARLTLLQSLRACPLLVPVPVPARAVRQRRYVV